MRTIEQIATDPEVGDCFAGPQGRRYEVVAIDANGAVTYRLTATIGGTTTAPTEQAIPAAGWETFVRGFIAQGARACVA